MVFIGYHARGGTANAINDHTSTGNVTDFAINGRSLPEAGFNALMAGHFGVPVVFVAGDQAIVQQVEELFAGVGPRHETGDRGGFPGPSPGSRSGRDLGLGWPRPWGIGTGSNPSPCPSPTPWFSSSSLKLRSIMARSSPALAGPATGS